MGRITIETIGYIENNYKEKFGIPRQSGLSESVISKIVFDDEYKDPNYFKGIEEFSHIWLIWYFSDVNKKHIKPTVRPPKLGGNKRVGVFASRSPFRPNRIGISCVKLIKADYGYKKITLYVTGADLMDGTPIYDIKPYVKYADCRPHATCGYVDSLPERRLKVVIPSEISASVTDKTIMSSLVEVLSLDPRPSYHDDSSRIYGLSFGGYNVRFKVEDGVLTVVGIE